MPADLNGTVGELLTSWLAAAKAKLSQPEKLAAKELNRLGELLLAVMAAQAERERQAAFQARMARAEREMQARMARAQAAGART